MQARSTPSAAFSARTSPELEHVLAAVQDGITVQDTSGELVYANPKALAILGFGSWEELRRTPVARILGRFACFDEAGAPYSLADLPGRRVLRGEHPAPLVLRFRVLATGQERWSRIAATPLLAEDGSVRAVVNVFHDVTEQRRAAVEARLLADAGVVLSHALDPEAAMRALARLVVEQRIADLSSVYMADGSALRYLASAHREPAIEAAVARAIADEGVPARVAEAARTRRSLFFPEAGDDLVRETRDPGHRAFRAGLRMRSSIILPLVARDRTLGAMTLSTLGEDGRAMTEADVAFAQDLAARAALVIDNARLYAEAEAARAAAEHANGRLRELDQMKTQLINTVSHELRTPLTPLELQVEILRSHRDLDAEMARTVDIVERNLGRLTTLVRDLGDVAKLQGGKLALRRAPMDVAGVVREALESFEAPAARAGVALRFDAPAELLLLADAQRVTQVVYNLLTNALKFTPRGGRVDVEVARLAEGAEVRVRDTGAGLTEEQQARLFLPFSQVHDTMAHPVPGTGLGLFICKGIVEEHGGHVGVASEGPGCGATFWFRLPAPPASG